MSLLSRYSCSSTRKQAVFPYDSVDGSNNIRNDRDPKRRQSLSGCNTVMKVPLLPKTAKEGEGGNSPPHNYHLEPISYGEADVAPILPPVSAPPSSVSSSPHERVIDDAARKTIKNTYYYSCLNHNNHPVHNRGYYTSTSGACTSLWQATIILHDTQSV